MNANKKTKKKENESHYSWFDVVMELVVDGLMEVVFLLLRLLFRAVKMMMD
jgi:hypothetical protein